MGAIVLLSLCCAITEGALTHIWYPDFVAAAQGIPLDLLALVARGACVPGSHRTVTIGEREFLAGYHPQGTVQTSD